MTVMQFRSPVTYPVHRLGWQRPAGSREFRVTQPFGSLDGFFKGQAHGAVDLGNGHCHDPIVAMRGGLVRRTDDNAKALGLAATDALGVVIDHGEGITTEYWHLDGYTGPASGWVNAGQQIGILGDTGIGAVCHLHVEAKRNGVRFDPEPLIFGGSIDTEADADVKVPGMNYFATGVVGKGNRLRPLTGLTIGSTVLDQDTKVSVLAIWRTGPAYTLNGVQDNDWFCVMYQNELWLVAKPLLTGIAPTDWLRLHVPLPDADCVDEVTIAAAQAKTTEQSRWRAWLGLAPK